MSEGCEKECPSSLPDVLMLVILIKQIKGLGKSKNIKNKTSFTLVQKRHLALTFLQTKLSD